MKMWRLFFCVLCVLSFASVFGFSQLQNDICGNNTQKRARSCTTQILGDISTGKCHIEYYTANSNECKSMNFGQISSNFYIGGVSLRPYILSVEKHGGGSSLNRAVLNITFSNIKWKTMKFRFQTLKQRNLENHCRNIILSNDVKVNDQSILYYDCYWPLIDSNFNGQSHFLDFEATDDKVVNRGQYYFNIPSAKTLSETVTEEEWVPFLYVELLTGTMKLHIVPPPPQLNITGYQIKIMKESDKGTHVHKDTIVNLVNKTAEVTYDCSLMTNGSYHFLVTPLHRKCMNGVGECQTVESPKFISDVKTLDVCKATITALIVAFFFFCYVIMSVVRRYWCKDYSLAAGNELPPPTKALVIYSPTNKTHAECVISFVNYLRSEYGIDVMYEGDVSATSHGDPARWACEAFNAASHVIYVVGPAEDSISYNIYEKPLITANRDVDKILLSLVQANRVSKCRKMDIINVFFEYSNGKIPNETSNGKVFHLLKDWQKLIAYLTKNLLPKKQLARTEKGMCLLINLEHAKKLLSGNCDNVKKSNQNMKKSLV